MPDQPHRRFRQIGKQVAGMVRSAANGNFGAIIVAEFARVFRVVITLLPSAAASIPRILHPVHASLEVLQIPSIQDGL